MWWDKNVHGRLFSNNPLDIWNEIWSVKNTQDKSWKRKVISLQAYVRTYVDKTCDSRNDISYYYSIPRDYLSESISRFDELPEGMEKSLRWHEGSE